MAERKQRQSIIAEILFWSAGKYEPFIRNEGKVRMRNGEGATIIHADAHGLDVRLRDKGF